MDRPVRWGVLSTALITTKLLGGAAQSGAVEVLATASRSRDKALRHAERWGIPRAYAGYEELLADPDVEAVYVPLPNGLHHTWTMRALEAGKHGPCGKADRPPPPRGPGGVGLAPERGC